MPYHPTIGDLGRQRARIVAIVAMLAVAGVLLAVSAQRPKLPSDPGYRLSGQQVMATDLTFRFGTWLQQIGRQPPHSFAGQARLIIEQAVAAYERQALTAKPNPRAIYRLGVIYGHRGYYKQAEDFFARADLLDDGHSELYRVLARVYSGEKDVPADELDAQCAVLAQQAGWLADLTLYDCYKRAGEEKKAGEVQAAASLRTHRFGISMLLLALALLGLLLLGLFLLVRSLLRWGLRLPGPQAQLPFVVPWTVIDVAEIIAVLTLGVVVAAIGAAWVRTSVGGENAHPLLLAVQYCVVAAIALAFVLWRVGAHSSRPLRSVGLRAPHPLRLISFGIGGYAVLVSLAFLLALVMRSVVGDAVPLTSTAENLVESTHTTGDLIIFAVLVCVIAPIFEEIIFRGYVYAGLRRFLSPPRAMAVAGLLFAAVHLSPEALVVITLLGVALCYLYERTRSLLPGMIAHGLHNGIVLAALIVHSM